MIKLDFFMGENYEKVAGVFEGASHVLQAFTSVCPHLDARTACNECPGPPRLEI